MAGVLQPFDRAQRRRPPERAAVVGRAGAARLEALGYEEGAANLRYVTAGALTDVGHWNEADRLAAEALRGPVGDYTRWLLQELRGTIAVRRGDFASAQVLLDDVATCGARAPREACRAGRLLVELALGEGRLDLVRTLMEEAWMRSPAATPKTTCSGWSRSGFAPKPTRPAASGGRRERRRASRWLVPSG